MAGIRRVIFDFAEDMTEQKFEVEDLTLPVSAGDSMLPPVSVWKLQLEIDARGEEEKIFAGTAAEIAGNQEWVGTRARSVWGV
jgi:hypothetical protein